ncbi:hypothetical protein EVAR_37119_1 [Eumeta japonica]|uniref:Uncharacterized protein n=1 Tax=Eumeta variegata TaxID=151549 RepID=A0A4C1XN68_EUMVA|nr:hypothetical protein EVAR_37119_1 [Eumeta japonica]
MRWAWRRDDFAWIHSSVSSTNQKVERSNATPRAITQINLQLKANRPFSRHRKPGTSRHRARTSVSPLTPPAERGGNEFTRTRTFVRAGGRSDLAPTRLAWPFRDRQTALLRIESFIRFGPPRCNVFDTRNKQGYGPDGRFAH